MIVCVIGGLALAAAAIAVFCRYRTEVPPAPKLSEKRCTFKTSRIPVSVGGHELFVLRMKPRGRAGRLPTVVCVHGFGASYRYFRYVVGKWLAQAGFQVVCFDFYGGRAHSRSGGSLIDLTIPGEVTELNAVLDAVMRLDTTDPERVFLLGTSQGGLVSALAAAKRENDLRAMVLYYPAFNIPELLTERFRSADDVPERFTMFGKTVSKRYTDGMLGFEPYSAAAGYTRPVLILHGDADTIVDVSYGKRAEKTYRDASCIVLPGEIHGFTAGGRAVAAKEVYRFLTKRL